MNTRPTTFLFFLSVFVFFTLLCQSSAYQIHHKANQPDYLSNSHLGAPACVQQCVTTPSGCRVCYKKCSQQATFSSCKSNPCERQTFKTQQQRILCLIRQPESQYDDETQCMLTCCGVTGFSYEDIDQCSETYNNTQFILKILALMLPLVIVIVPLCVCWITMEFKDDEDDLNSDQNTTNDRDTRRNQYFTQNLEQRI